MQDLMTRLKGETESKAMIWLQAIKKGLTKSAKPLIYWLPWTGSNRRPSD